MENLVSENMPIYKANNFGVENLSAIELISLILGKNNTEVAQQICDKAKTLKGLSRLSQADLLQIKGIGANKANSLLAAFELMKRINSERNITEKYSCPLEMYNFFRPRIGNLDHEEVWVMLLNHNFNLIQAKRLSVGGLTETAFDVRSILKEALLNNATLIAVAHNHPSGRTQPSSQDDNVTKLLRDAAKTMRISLIDHIIVTDEGFYSYSENGKL